jgi:choline kinase
MVDIGGGRLLDYQILTLRRLGVSEICVVIGYRAQRMMECLELRGCTWRVNDRFAETNSLYSLSLALDWLRQDL